MQQTPATPQRHRNISRASEVEDDWFAYQNGDGQPDSRLNNPPNGNTGQNEATKKVQLDRNLSVRSEICISPSWSRSEERSRRKKELKRLAKEQKALEKKLKREAKGKPREPRRLTKAGPSSRASSAYSNRPRFSSASSIRSFWSNRTSRAGSTHDLGQLEEPSSSHAEGLSKRYKFLGVFPRRVNGASGGELQSKPQPDPPVPTLHPARKIFDLRASAKAFEQQESPAQDSHSRKDKPATGTTRATGVAWTGDRSSEPYQFPPPATRTLEASPITDTYGPLKENHRPVSPPNRAEMDYFRLPRNNEVASNTQLGNPPPLRSSEGTHLRRQNTEENKPGNLIGADFSRKSPLDTFAANVASIIAERDQTPTTNFEHARQTASAPTKEVTEESYRDPGRTPSGDANRDRVHGSVHGVYSREEPGTALEGDPGPSVITSIPQPDQGLNCSVQQAPSVVEKPTPKSVAPFPVKPSPISKPETGPYSSLPTAPLSNHAKVNNKIPEYRPKPTATYIRDPNFQSSPLAGPPLVPQDTINSSERAPPEAPVKDELPVPHRPAKLRRRSVSATGVDITSSHATTGLGTYFPRLWRSGKKEAKAVDHEQLQNEGDNERENIRQGKRPVRVVNRAGDSASSQLQPGLTNGTENPTMNASTPALSSLSSANNSKSPSMHARRTASDTLQQVRVPPRNVDLEKRPFTINLPSRGNVGFVYAKNGTGTPSLQDLIDDETLMTSKGVYSARHRGASSSSVFSTGSLGQRTNKTSMHGGQAIAKMFVICCRCKFWHDMPSEAYANLIFHQGGTPIPDSISAIKTEVNGINPNKGKTPDTSSTPSAMSRTSLKPRDRSRSTSRPAMTRDGVPISTSINCCWCNHTMARACCAGWTAIVNLHEKHH